MTNHLETLAAAAQAAAINYHGVNFHWDSSEARFIERAFNDAQALATQVLPGPGMIPKAINQLWEMEKLRGEKEILTRRVDDLDNELANFQRHADNSERIIAETRALLHPEEQTGSLVDGVRITVKAKEQAEARVKELERQFHASGGLGFAVIKASAKEYVKAVEKAQDQEGVSHKDQNESLTDYIGRMAAGRRAATEALKDAEDRLAAIDAAKAGEPPIPEPVTMERIDVYERRLVRWGRQGWDAAAAMRVELAEANQRIESTFPIIWKDPPESWPFQAIMPRKPEPGAPPEAMEAYADLLRKTAASEHAKAHALGREMADATARARKEAKEAETERCISTLADAYPVCQFRAHKDGRTYLSEAWMRAVLTPQEPTNG